MILLDLFSGYGGFHLGLQEAGLQFTKTYFSEKDKHAIANYKYNFTESEYASTVEHIHGSGIKADIITFGSPCQGFSVAGQGAGMRHEGSGLIRYAVDIVAKQKPHIFIWENVKGVLTRAHRKDFWAVVQAFARIGCYRLEWQLLNTVWWLPQNRERIFLIGHLGGKSGCEIFPVGESGEGINEGATETANIRTITAGGHSGGHSGGHHSGMTLIRHRSDQPYSVGEIAPTIRNSDKAEVRIVTHNMMPRSGNPKQGGTGHLTRTDGIAYNLDTGNTNAIEILKQKDYTKGNSQGARVIDPSAVSITLTSEGGGHGGKTGLYEVGNSIRRLTPTECERLQGLPDGWTKNGNYDGTVRQISDSQRYKLCGNGVSIPPVKAIGEKLFNSLIS